MKFNKIHIVGGPGSGKSYAADKLSKILKISHYDLDDILWDTHDTDYTKKRERTERKSILKTIVTAKKWITEGASASDWIEPIFKHVDVVIFIRPNRYVRALRIIKRTTKGKLKILKRKKETWFGLLGLLVWNHHWEKKKLIEVEKKIKKYSNKIHYFDKADLAIEYILRENKIKA